MDNETHNVGFDIVVVGAGPAGSIFSYVCARKGLKVCLIDKHKFPREKPCGDFITNYAITELEALRLELPRGVYFSVLRYMEVYLSKDLRIPFEQISSEKWGFGITWPRKSFDDYLCNNAIDMGAKFVDGFTVTKPLLDGMGAVIGVKGTLQKTEYAVKGRLVILATGGAGTLPNKFGLSRPAPSMVAKRAYFEGNLDEERVIIYYSKKMIPGYAWIFPLGNQTFNVGVGYQPAKVQNFSFAKLLENEPKFAGLLKEAKPITNFAGHPVQSGFSLFPVTKQNVLLVGETCGLVNPLTGSGIVNAIESARISAQIICSSLDEYKRSANNPLQDIEARFNNRYLSSFQKIELIRDILFSNYSSLWLVGVLLQKFPRLRRTFLKNIIR